MRTYKMRMECPADAKVIKKLKEFQLHASNIKIIITTLFPSYAKYIPTNNMEEVHIQFDAEANGILIIYNAMKRINKDLHVAYQSLAPLVALENGEKIYTGRRDDIFGTL